MKTEKNEVVHQVKCLHPQVCWICGTVYCKKDGVLSPNLVFNADLAHKYFLDQVRGSLLRAELGEGRLVEEMMLANRIEVACGKCAICQIQKRKEMSIRLTHEASMFENSCFITLTYDEKNVPSTSVHAMKYKDDSCYSRGRSADFPLLTLLPRDVQLFMKRLRRHLEYVPKFKKHKRDHVDHVRFFAVGEYGSKTKRPHYHILIFGWNPSDATLYKLKDGRPIFRSPQIEKLWTYGFSSFSMVSPYVAKYCARYVTKKFARLTEGSVYDKCIVPEFTLQSTRQGGIGASWFDKFGEAACRVGLCSYRLEEKIVKAAIPRYYWNRLRKRNLTLWLDLRDQKMEFIKNHSCVGYKLHLLENTVDVNRLADEHFASLETF